MVCGVAEKALEHPYDVRARILRTLRFLRDGYGVSFGVIAKECGLCEPTVRYVYWGTQVPGFEVQVKLHDGCDRLLREREKARKAVLAKGGALGGVGGMALTAVQVRARTKGPGSTVAARLERERLENLGENADESP